MIWLKATIKKLRNYLLLDVLYPTIYKIGTLRPLKESKVIMVENYLDTLSNNFRPLYKLLNEQYSFQIDIHFLKKNSVGNWNYLFQCIYLLWNVANAKYIFLADATNLFCRIPIRKGSIFTQLWHACGAFKRFGLSIKDSFNNGNELEKKYSNYTYNTYMTVSSPEIVEAYKEATGLPFEKIIPIGISRTDDLFNKCFIEKAYMHFFKLIPEAVGKTVILYTPTFRGTASEPRMPKSLSIPEFFHTLSDSCILIVKNHPLIKGSLCIPEEYQNFAYDVSAKMDIQEMLCVADICITDYSTVIFEYSIFEKPMIFFAYDLEEYYDRRGFFYDYREFVPGPVFFTNGEMLSYIKELIQGTEHADLNRIIQFRKQFMAACDGNATKRIVERVFEEDLKKFKKNMESR